MTTTMTDPVQGTVTRVEGLQIRARTTLVPETSWARPLGAVTAPAVGDVVWIFFEGGDPEFPVWAPTFSDVSQTGVGDKHYTHTQGSAASVWTITHNLAKRPSVVVRDSLGRIVEGDLEYPDLNTVTVTFSASISGAAYLN